MESFIQKCVRENTRYWIAICHFPFFLELDSTIRNFKENNELTAIMKIGRFIVSLIGETRTFGFQGFGLQFGLLTEKLMMKK